jgi:hypothetical protein
VLTLNQVFVALSLSFTGSPIHPPLGTLKGEHGLVPQGKVVLPRESRASPHVRVAPNGDDGAAHLTRVEHGTIHDQDLGSLRGTSFTVTNHLLTPVRGRGIEDRDHQCHQGRRHHYRGHLGISRPSVDGLGVASAGVVVRVGVDTRGMSRSTIVIAVSPASK